jgi:hypothetical protein
LIHRAKEAISPTIGYDIKIIRKTKTLIGGGFESSIPNILSICLQKLPIACKSKPGSIVGIL